MGIQTISLDRVIGNMIHHPRIDGVPLYVRVDGQMEYGDCRLATTKSDKWVAASKKAYGSPDNIRRIFITHRAVYVHLYKPVVGVKNKSLRREIAFPTDFQTILNNYKTSKEMGTAPEYRVRQYGLSALCKPWVCSNIEEIYFDWSLFLSEDINNLGMGNMFNVYEKATSELINSEPIKVLFETACLKGVKNLSERFPRLRCIGYIQHLEDIYHKVIPKSGEESLEDMMKPWCVNEYVKILIKEPLSAVSIYNIPNMTKLNTKYSLKDGIYMYDRDVLKDYFMSLEVRITDYYRNKRDNAIDSKKEALVNKVKKSKSSFEITIDEIYAKEGINGATIAIRLALDGISKDEKLKIINNMSDEGKERYTKIAGIKG